MLKEEELQGTCPALGGGGCGGERNHKSKIVALTEYIPFLLISLQCFKMFSNSWCRGNRGALVRLTCLYLKFSLKLSGFAVLAKVRGAMSLPLLFETDSHQRVCCRVNN